MITAKKRRRRKSNGTELSNAQKKPYIITKYADDNGLRALAPFPRPSPLWAIVSLIFSPVRVSMYCVNPVNHKGLYQA